MKTRRLSGCGREQRSLDSAEEEVDKSGHCDGLSITISITQAWKPDRGRLLITCTALCQLCPRTRERHP